MRHKPHESTGEFGDQLGARSLEQGPEVRPRSARGRRSWDPTTGGPAATIGHLDRVALRPCVVCGRRPCDPHHPTFARGRGQKAPDAWAFPLCHEHHMAFHRGTGHFSGWSHHQRRAWQLHHVQVALYVFDDSIF
jgi:hypothetical protein